MAVQLQFRGLVITPMVLGMIAESRIIYVNLLNTRRERKPGIWSYPPELSDRFSPCSQTIPQNTDFNNSHVDEWFASVDGGVQHTCQLVWVLPKF